MCGPKSEFHLEHTRRFRTCHAALGEHAFTGRQACALELAAGDSARQCTKRSDRAEFTFTCNAHNTMSDSDSFEKSPPMKGKGARGYMSPAERNAMIEWLDMDREGQKEGQPMKNWRSIYGGAAKGRTMGAEADEVHSKGGYVRLAAYVNVQCKIKSDKKRAWDEDVAEKRWTALKKSYKKALRMQAPLNTNFETDDAFDEAKKKFQDEQDKCCLHFQKLHDMLKDHPGMHPHKPTDSMAAAAAPQESKESEPDMRGKEDTMGVVRKRKDGEEKPPKQKKKAEEFHLRKPGGAESASKKRMSIHEMFLESQMKQTALDTQKLMVDAVGKLAAANIPPAAMGEYLTLMGLGKSAHEPVAAGSDSDQ